MPAASCSSQVFGIETLWGIDFFWIAAIGLVLLTALYTIFGGMKSVLYTSVLQTPILLLGSYSSSSCSASRNSAAGMKMIENLLRSQGQRLRRHHGQSHPRQQRPAVSLARRPHRLRRHRFLVLVYRPVHRPARTFGQGREGGTPRHHLRRLSQAPPRVPLPYPRHDCLRNPSELNRGRRRGLPPRCSPTAMSTPTPPSPPSWPNSFPPV